MKRIERVSIIGMGALGILYGSFFAERLGKDHVTFLVDKERLKRYEGVEVTCNGKPWSFRVKGRGAFLRERPGSASDICGKGNSPFLRHRDCQKAGWQGYHYPVCAQWYIQRGDHRRCAGEGACALLRCPGDGCGEAWQ